MMFAQSAGGYSPASGFFVVSIIVAGAIFAFSALFLGLLLRHLRTSREMTHRERLRAIEMGQPLDSTTLVDAQAKYMHNAFWISFWMVFAVPGGAFSAAATTSERVGSQLGVLLAIWISAAAASVASVICATVLMVHSRWCGSGPDGGQTTKPLPKWTEH